MSDSRHRRTQALQSKECLFNLNHFTAAKTTELKTAIAVKQSLIFVAGTFPCWQASRQDTAVHFYGCTPNHHPQSPLYSTPTYNFPYFFLNSLPLTGELTLLLAYLTGPQPKQRGNIASFEDTATASCTQEFPTSNPNNGFSVTCSGPTDVADICSLESCPLFLENMQSCNFSYLCWACPALLLFPKRISLQSRRTIGTK